MPGAQLATGLSGQLKLPPHLLAALVPLVILFAALDIYCLIDLARARSVRHAPKLAWVIVILIVSAPLGALLYLFAGRDRGQQPGPVPATDAVVAAAPADRPSTPSTHPPPSNWPPPSSRFRPRPTSPPAAAPGGRWSRRPG